MKQLFTLIVLLGMAVPGFSQWWFDIGAKGAYGPTLMYDKSAFDSGTYKHKLSTGYGLGGRLGFNYGHHVGLSVEYNTATSKQDFEYHSDVYNKFKWKHNDVVGVFRYSGNGAFIELGAELSNINKVTVDNADLQNVADVTGDFEKSYLSGIFGFGSYLAGNDLLSVNLGIRLHWGFDDMVNETGKENNEPFYAVPEQISPDNKTFATAAQLQLEINYAFGRFAKSSCHDRWRLILFN